MASGPLQRARKPVFMLGGQRVVKTVTLRADDPLIEVELELSALQIPPPWR
ncbi:MAG: hypothetical protein U0X92_18220 [Anaerolineales bacterium]